MRTNTYLLVLTCTLCLHVKLPGQAVAEYGVVTAAGTTGAAAGAKGVGKSIGGVFDSLNKKLAAAKDEKTAEVSKETAVKEVTVPAAAAPAAVPPPPAKPRPVRLVKSAEIRLGTTRAELVRDLGKPSMSTSQTDENGFEETFFYPGAEQEVVVTLRGGKVVRVLPPPEPEPAAPKPLPPG